MPFIIINADDFGISSIVNKEIERCMKEGLISSSSVMANGIAFEEVALIITKYPNISCGVHLTLDEFDSLTKSAILYKYGITDNNGTFIKGSIWKKHYPKELKDAIYDEWKAQILKILNSGIDISHIDGHHHCHTILELLEVLKNLCNEFKIFKVRQAYIRPLFISNSRIFKISQNKDDIKLSIIEKSTLKIKKYLWRRKSRKYFKMVNYFFDINFYLKNFYLGNQFEKIEVMCHPGHHALNDYELLKELKLICCLKLISYHDFN